MKPISRREFGALVAAGMVSGRFATSHAHGQTPAAAVTAAEILERIRRNVGVDWRSETVDGVKAGDGSTVVTGVVTTAMATLEVLRKASAAGANLVVTSEPTFYGRADARTPAPRRGPGQGAAGAAPLAASPPPPDPVYEAKNAFIDGQGLVVIRFNDHWRARRPDPFVQGLADSMGWNGREVAASQASYDVPELRLDELVRELKGKLGARGGIRVVGDPRNRVRRVALLPGSTPITASLAALPGADVIVAGEVREWESVEYARDVVFSGQPKGLVLLGRVVSEDPGMARCARWLESLVPEVPVRHIAAGDPYWRPAS
ncbi:MAG TPA: Nif3-like dinuclear metal center hexameric protein [Longimicrobiaceae bacterium]